MCASREKKTRRRAKKINFMVNCTSKMAKLSPVLNDDITFMCANLRTLRVLFERLPNGL
jgi:hypothetical protein